MRKKIGSDVAFTAMMAAYDHDDKETVSTFRSDMGFARALRRVAPKHGRLEPVRAWRGIRVKNAHPAEAATGISWTTERDIAAWFAMRHYQDAVRSFVFCAEFEPAAVIAFHDARSESEVIVDLVGFSQRLVSVDYDTTPRHVLERESAPSASALASWREAFDREQSKRRRAMTNRLIKPSAMSAARNVQANATNP